MAGDRGDDGMPLDGLRVLDFTWALAGPFCTMQLADMGAEVVKVEHPALEEHERGLGPYVEGISSYFFSVNRGKKGIAVDLKHAGGLALALQLAERADVLVENFRPGTMARLGLGYEQLRVRNPRLVYASVSGFGQTGPYHARPAVDAVAQALGGTMSLNGEPAKPPIRVGVSIGDMVGGLYAAFGILAALRARDRSGRGQQVDVALMDGQIALCENAIVRQSATAERPTRQGGRHPLIAPFGPFPTADGYVVIANMKNWPLFCALVDRDDLAVDERFVSNTGRVTNVDALEQELSDVLRRRTTEEWLRVLEEGNSCSAGKVNTIADLFEDAHVRAREMLVELPLPYGLPGSLAVAGQPVHLSETPAHIRSPMPGHGEHTRQVLRGWAGLDDAEVDRLAAAGAIKAG